MRICERCGNEYLPIQNRPNRVYRFCTNLCRVEHHKQLNKKQYVPIVNFKDEQWININGYEDYSISNYGRVRTFKRQDELLKQFDLKNGYKRVYLFKEDVRRGMSVHRLVALHFIDNSENKPDVNHKDCDTSNNHKDNLEWCTKKENIVHAYANNRVKNQKGSDRHNAILTDEIVIDMLKRYKAGERMCDIAKMYNYSRGNFWSIIKNKSWKHIDRSSIV